MEEVIIGGTSGRDACTPLMEKRVIIDMAGA